MPDIPKSWSKLTLYDRVMMIPKRDRNFDMSDEALESMRVARRFKISDAAIDSSITISAYEKVNVGISARG